jgi:3-methyladenine DNA glycosylase/8-oxoguanine DNA glycosylase
MTPDADRLRQATEHISRGDARLARWIDAVGPCQLRVDPGGGPYAALVQAILYQQLNGKAAATIHARLLRRVGRAHPRPADIAALDDATLRAVGLSRQKTAYLRDLTARVQGGLSLRGLGRLDDEAIVERLTTVKGIGRWTVEMYLIFRLGRLDVLPLDDYGVRKGAQRAYRLRTPPDAARLRRLGEPWRPYRSVASWYLWRVAEAEGDLGVTLRPK